MIKMNIGEAVRALKDGKQVTRGGWNGAGQYLELQQPGVLGKMTLPYVYLRTSQGALVPWTASQTDLLADDWQVRDAEKDELRAKLARSEAEQERLRVALCASTSGFIIHADDAPVRASECGTSGGKAT